MKDVAGAMALSKELARELSGVTMAPDKRHYIVPSRTTAGVTYRVEVTSDGQLICNCPAAFNRLKCWHVAYVREEIGRMNESSTALVPVQVQPSVALLPSERELSLIDRAAQLALSGAIALPRELNTQAKVAAVMLYGLELGLKPLTSLKHLYIVNGRVQPSAEVMLGIAQSREHDIRLQIEELTETTCTMRIIRPSRRVNESYTVTWAEIERAGLTKNPMNQQYPRDRLRWHTVKRLLRIHAPDLINGLDGIAIADVEVPDAELDEADLYNPGDAIEGEYAQRPENVDEDGVLTDGSDEGPEITPPTKGAITAAYHATREARGEEFMSQVRPAMQQHWPQAFLANSNRLSALSEAEGFDVLAFLENETPKVSEKQASLT